MYWSIEEDFSDSRVLIALNNDESLSFNTLESYTVLNSVDIDNVKSISDVMPHTYQLVKTKTEIKNGVSSISPQYIPQYECTKCGAITLTAPPSYS